MSWLPMGGKKYLPLILAAGALFRLTNGVSIEEILFL